MKLPFGSSPRRGERNQESFETNDPATTKVAAAQPLMPESQDDDQLLHQRLAGLREKLLDLSNRNRLLSFKHSDRSRTHIRIIDELPDVLFSKLQDGEKLTFEALPEPESRPRDEETDEFLITLEAARATDDEYRSAIGALAEGENQSRRETEIERALRDRVREQLGMPPWVDRTQLSKEDLARSHGLEPGYDVPQPQDDDEEEEERHLDRLIQTLLFPREMDRKLAGIRDQARTMNQEAGVNTLYAAFGFLEWREASQSDRKHFSPLLLLPVSLEYKRGQPWGKYRLFSELPDVEANKTLEIRLGRDSGFQMPSFSEDDTPETFLEKVSHAIRERQGWRVRRFLTVGNFGFSKLAMYNDLDPENWPTNRALGALELIRKMLLGAPPNEANPIDAEDYPIDSPVIDEKEIALITDADASQHSAVIDVIEGKNLVIKGPPGTGKSQTITNIIAAALSKGKRVLFVAEKMAALEVVESRLRDAGITDFCLQVHSSKTSKMEVLGSLRQRLALRQSIEPLAKLDDKLVELRGHRDRLNRYVSVMNKPLGARGLTVHEILWGEKRTKAESGNAWSLLRGISFDTPDRIDNQTRSIAHQVIQGAFGRAADIVSRCGSLDLHPWSWLKNGVLNPFEVEELERTGHAWLESLDRLNDNIEEFEAQVGPLEANSVDRLSQTVEAIAALPDPLNPMVVVLASSLVDLDLQVAASQFSELLRHKNGDISDTSRVFASGALPPMSEDWQTVAHRILEVLEPLERLCPEVGNIGRFRAEIADLERDAKRLDRILSITERLYTAAGLAVELTHESVAVALNAVGLLKETTREALLHRSPDVLDEAAEIPLKRAVKKSRELCASRENLERLIVLRPLPALENVVAHTAALRGAGALGFLSKRVREAKQFFKSLAKEPRNLNVAQMILCGSKLSQYLDDRRLLADDGSVATACGRWFEGADTDFELLFEVNNWARNVRQKLPGVDEQPSLRDFLFEGSTGLISDLVVEAEQVDAEDAIQLVERQSDHDKGIGQSHALLTERISLLNAALRVLEDEKIGSDAPFGAVADVAQRLGDLEPLRATIAEMEPSLTLTTELLAEAVDFIARLTDAGLSLPAVKALSSNRPDAGIGFLRTWSVKTSKSREEEAKIRMAFEDLAEIDCAQLCEGRELSAAPISALRDRLTLALGDSNGLKEHSALQGALEAAKQSTSAEFVDTLISNPPPPEQAIAAYDWLLYRGSAKLAFNQIPELSQFNGLDFQSARQSFRKLDREILQLERERLRSSLCSLRVSYGNGVGRKSSFTDLALIQNELGKKKRHIPLRQLFVRASRAINQMKPCFMMSPLSVATYLPAGKFEFDLVVIDEASQMPPEDALGAIARSAQVVVVGDPMQLPPTSFFRRFDDVMDEDDDEEEDESIDVESILDQALAVFRPPRDLRWHYRSRHQSLIAFSNKHFYNDGLTVFPSPVEAHEKSGVKLIKVDGLYADQHNAIEAQAMAEWAKDFMTARPDESLGLVAINQLQRDLIMDEMGRISQRDSQVDAYLRNWEGTLYPFFVKNLENVQGDERDVIAISLVRGPNVDGKVTQNFGPISQKNGHRRLNVLFTRARNQLVVFSSIGPEQIDIRPHTAQGPRILRSFLDYALTGRIDPGAEDGRQPDSDFEVAVANRLRGFGYEAVPQVGVGGFYIDLGVRHPEFPGTFLAGVECDGATYHSAKSARDRDRLREEVLAGLGWKLYRVWSTDWFADPDTETEKLVRFVELVAEDRRQLLRDAASAARATELNSAVAESEESDRSSPEFEDLETELPTDIEIDRVELFSDEEQHMRIDGQLRGVSTQDIASTPVVQVGDTVTFHFDDHEEDRRTMTIVSGASDAERHKISRDSPIGSAVLGSAVGEDVEIDAPIGVRIAIIDDISKPSGSDAGSSTRSNQDDSATPAVSGFEPSLAPQMPASAPMSASARSGVQRRLYQRWEPHQVPDPRDSQRSDVARHLHEIIAVEGPIRVKRAYRLYAHACGIDRVGRVVRSKLNGALYHLAGQNQVILEKEGPDTSQINAIARVRGTPRVLIRPSGGRTFWEVPPSELAAVVLEEQNAAPRADAAEIYHRVLARYDVGRLTSRIGAELERIERSSSDGQFSAQLNLEQVH